MTDRVNGSIDKHWSRGATLFAQKPDGESCWNLIRAEIMFWATRDTSVLSARGGGQAFLAFLAHYRLTEEPICQDLKRSIHLSDMCAEMCSAFNSSINQWLSSTDQWVFGCVDKQWQKHTNTRGVFQWNYSVLSYQERTLDWALSCFVVSCLVVTSIALCAAAKEINLKFHS